MTENQAAVRIWRDRAVINLPNGLGPEPVTLLRRFARRVMALPEVTQVRLGSERLDANLKTLEIRFETGLSTHAEFLERLYRASDGQTPELSEDALPPRTQNDPLRLFRYGASISAWELINRYNGRVKLYHPKLCGNAELAVSLEAGLRSQPGIREAYASPESGSLRVAYDTATPDLETLTRILEAPLSDSLGDYPLMVADPINFTTVNTSLGLAALGALAFPPVTPLCAGLIIAGNLGTVRDAARQISAGKLGTPAWMTALLACSVASGQVLAFAITDWCWHYWERRWRQDLSRQSRRLLENVLPIPREVGFTTPEGIEVSRAVAMISNGQSLSLESGEVLPVDGKVKNGVALVNERAVTGTSGLVRKERGDAIYAGSQIYHGKLEIAVQAHGNETYAARIAGAVTETARKLQTAPDVHNQAVTLADRTMPPTLALAGVGLAMGNLFVVGAILHQDWYSCAHTAAPLFALEDIGQVLKQGLIVRNPDLLSLVEKVNFVVIQDQPALRLRGSKLSHLETSLPDHTQLLSLVAGAALYLGDNRTAALLATCMAQCLTVKQPELLELDKNGVTVRANGQIVGLRNLPNSSSKPPSLTVEIDNRPIATLHFDIEPRPLAAGVVQELRSLGLQVFLVSEHDEAETSELAKQLGVDNYSGELDSHQTLLFLQGLQRRGLKTLYVGHGPQRTDIAAAVQASVSVIDAAQLQDDAAFGSLLGTELVALIELFTLSRSSSQRLKQTFRSGALFNLLCIGGGFAGVLNGITSGILGTLSVVKVRQRALQNLEEKFPYPSK